MNGQPSHPTQQGRPAGDRLPMMVSIVKTDVEVPPVVDQRDQIGHQAAGSQLLRREAVPTPLVFELIVDVLCIGSFPIKTRQGHPDRPWHPAWSPKPPFAQPKAPGHFSTGPIRAVRLADDRAAGVPAPLQEPTLASRAPAPLDAPNSNRSSAESLRALPTLGRCLPMPLRHAAFGKPAF